MSDPVSDWKDWFFSQARKPPSFLRRQLFWNEIKPGCSRKQLELLAKNVLDVDDPAKVDWTNVRAAHLYIKREEVSSRAVLSGLSNIKRLASKGLMKNAPDWFRRFSGWTVRRASTIATNVIDEQEFRKILEEVCKDMPPDMVLALEALFALSYYCGLKTSQAGLIRRADMTSVDGRTYLYKSGRLIELPDHVKLPIGTWLRARKLGYQAENNPYMFRLTHRKVLSKYPKLHETYQSLRRMRG